LHHGAATVTVTSDCTEVIMFGGWNKDGALIANTVVVRFSELSSLGYSL